MWGEQSLKVLTDKLYLFIFFFCFFNLVETSDFAAACGRARAFADFASRPKFEMGSSTSPEPSPSALDVDRFDFPVAQKDSDADKHRFESGGSFYEDEVLRTAKKDIAAFLGLEVRSIFYGS